jgi:hypothetical protein
MTRRSRREIAHEVDGLSSDGDAPPADADPVVSWEQPDGWEPSPDAITINFSEVST